MKKSFICAVTAAAVLLSGCSQFNQIAQNSSGIVLYYDTITDLNKNNIDSKNYKDLFLNENIEPGMNQETLVRILGIQPLEEEINVVKYASQSTETDTVGKWLANAEYKYSFKGVSPSENKIDSYTINSLSDANTFNDYLYLMRALTLKYDECTTEIYKSGTVIIDNAKLQNDKSVNEIINNYYANTFAEGQISISARWVEKDYIMTVNFNSPSDCSITYDFLR